MDLTQLANLGEFIGGVAVLATLLYLAIQLRQTNKTISASAFHGITSLIVPMRATLVATHEIGELMVRARHAGLADFDDVDRYRFGLCAGMIFRVCNDIYDYQKSGLISESQWNNWELAVEQNLAGRGMRDYWVENCDTYTPSFRALAAEIIRKLDANLTTELRAPRS